MPVRQRPPDPNRGAGRPTKIDDPCREVIREGQPTGEYLTVSESILADVRVGMSDVAAAGRAGITLQTLRDWERKGRALRTHPPMEPGRGGGKSKPRRLTAPEVRLRRFSVDLDRAHGEGEMLFASGLARAATQPRIKRETITVTEVAKDGTRVVRTTDKTTEEPPSESAMEYILERRYGSWAERAKLTLVDDDDIPVSNEAIALSVIDKIRQIARGQIPTPAIGTGDDPDVDEAGTDDDDGMSGALVPE